MLHKYPRLSSLPTTYRSEVVLFSTECICLKLLYLTTVIQLTHDYVIHLAEACICPHDSFKSQNYCYNYCDYFFLLDSFVDWRKISGRFSHVTITGRRQGHFSEVPYYFVRIWAILSRVVRLHLRGLCIIFIRFKSRKHKGYLRDVYPVNVMFCLF